LFEEEDDLVNCIRRKNAEYAKYAGETEGNPELYFSDARESSTSMYDESQIADFAMSAEELEKRKRQLEMLIDEI
jgi:hypothetical protein